ncbi:MAG TPA: DUF2298 domain-containing protein, partial [Anaerolineae bacterium]|nr:DUF2298 domain-containing protein [Anaerolineae bacterium]
IAFINGTLRSDYFPPQDPWLSGFAISYYYFGYVLMAMVTRLTGLVSTTAFNLYIPTLFALTLTAALGIVANLVSLYQSATSQNAEAQHPNFSLSTSYPLSSIYYLRFSAIATGLIAALFVAVLGNLEGLLEVLHKKALLPPGFWTWLDIRDLKVPPAGPSDSWIPDRFIWWWRGSRVLTDYTLTGHEQEVIDEFPFFSFLLGDVHPHVLALPFVLLVVALALNLLSSQKSVVSSQKSVTSNQKLEINPASEVEAAQEPSLESTSEPSAIVHRPAALGYELGAVSSLRSPAIVDKLREILQNNWSELLEATGGRLAFVLYALCLGSLFFLNAWDFPIYLSVVGLSFIAWLSPRRANWRMAIEPGLIGTGILAVVGVLLFLPFYATFQSQARGILPNLWNPTRLPQFLVFFGPFLVAVITLLIVLSRQNRAWQKYAGSTVLLTVLGPVLVMLLALTGVLLSAAGRDYVQGIVNDPNIQQVLGEATISSLVQVSLWRRLVNPWTFIIVGGLLGWALALFVGGLEGWKNGSMEDWKVKNGTEAEIQSDMEAALESVGGRQSAVGGHFSAPEQFVLILILVGLALPLSVEFIFLRDNFGIRMNTIFKFYFQAWVLLALASAFAVYYVSKKLPAFIALIWQIGLAVLVAGGLVYPVLAIPNKADFFQNEPTLNGMAWIANYNPGDYAAIEWLWANAADDAVVLEAPGAQYAAYQYTGRISALTGLPTLLGWGGHQSQWRGNYDEPARREPDIDLLYNTADIRQAQMLLDKYGISYVIVGPLERERYASPGLRKFEQFMAVAFEQDNTTIYQRR